MQQRFGNLSLHFHEVGSGKPILMLHGWSLDHLSMEGAMEGIFANRPGWKRIYLDLPGMGQSDAPDWLKTQDQVLEIIIKFTDTVIPGERFCVAGLSYGGLLAQGLVYRLAHRIDGVLFLVPSMASLDRETLPSHVVMHEESLDFNGLDENEVKAFRDRARG